MERKLFEDILISSIKISECISPDKYKCIIIQAGETKTANLPLEIDGKTIYAYKNYTPEAIEEAVNAGLFENAPALLRDKKSHLNVEDTGINSYVGNFSNVVYNYNNKCAEGIFNPIKKIKDKLAEVWQNVELSIAAEVSGYIYQNDFGKIGIAVTQINRIQSIDLVDYGNAGGKIIALVAESINNNSNNNNNNNNKNIKSNKNKNNLNPKLKIKIGEQKMNPEVKQAIFDFLMTAGLIGEGKTIDNITDEDLLNALWQHTMTLINTQSTTVAESQKQLSMIDKLAEQLKSAEATNKTNDVEKMKQIEKLMNEMKLANAQNYLNIKVAESKLPTPIKDKIHKLYDGKLLTNDEIDKILVAEQDAYSKINPTDVINNRNTDVKMIQNEFDKFKLQLDYLLIAPESRSKLSVAEQEEFKRAGVGNVSFLELYRQFTGDYKVTGKLGRGSLAESIQTQPFKLHTGESINTTTFAQLLGDSMHRSMLLEFTTSPFNNDWQKFFQVVPRNDFRTNTLVGVGGEGDLPVVNELATYNDATDTTEYASTYKLLKRGYIKKISQEAIINDDIGLIRSVPVKIGRAAARTLYKYVFNMVLSNPNMAYDNKALIHTDHNNNLGGVNFTKDNYWLAIKTLHQQKEKDNNEVIGLIPKYLLINMNDAPLAYELTTPAAMLANNVPSYYQTFAVEPIVIAHHTNNSWWLIADPSTATLGEIGFLNGNIEPEFFVADNPNLGYAFSNDGIQYKVRHVYAGTLTDHRAIVGSLITS